MLQLATSKSFDIIIRDDPPASGSAPPPPPPETKADGDKPPPPTDTAKPDQNSKSDNKPTDASKSDDGSKPGQTGKPDAKSDGATNTATITNAPKAASSSSIPAGGITTTMGNSSYVNCKYIVVRCFGSTDSL